MTNTNNLKSFNLVASDKVKIERTLFEKKSGEIREILNKITNDNYKACADAILKINYDQNLLESLRVNDFI